MRPPIFASVWLLGGSLLLSGCKIEPLAAGVTLTPSAKGQNPLPLTSLLPTLAVTSVVATQPTVSTPTAQLFLAPQAQTLLLNDDFSSNSSAWQMDESAQGALDIARGNLIMTARAPYTTLEARLPASIPNDFYAEVTVRTGLCGTDNDSFGMVFRRSKEEEYRLVVTCRGQMRFEHLNGATLTGANLWATASALLTGAPAENRIGVLAQGMEFKFFANGVACFSYRDPSLGSGKFGLFIRTEKSQLLTVSFDDLSVYSVKEKSP
jgi:hypothetical protein